MTKPASTKLLLDASRSVTPAQEEALINAYTDAKLASVGGDGTFEGGFVQRFWRAVRVAKALGLDVPRLAPTNPSAHLVLGLIKSAARRHHVRLSARLGGSREGRTTPPFERASQPSETTIPPKESRMTLTEQQRYLFLEQVLFRHGLRLEGVGEFKDEVPGVFYVLAHPIARPTDTAFYKVDLSDASAPTAREVEHRKGRGWVDVETGQPA